MPMEPIPVCLPPSPPVSELFSLLFLVTVLVVGVWVAGMFVLQYFDAVTRNAEHPAGPAYVRAFWREWLCETAALFLTPLGLFMPAGAERFDPIGGPPVVLLHGYGRNRSCFFVLFWRLRRYGHKNLYPLNIGPMTVSIAAMGEIVAKRIDEVSQLAGGQKVIAVCHSMGGLAVRSCLQQYPETPIAKVITLGTPHAGTRTAYLAPGESCRQAQPGSTFLATLTAQPSVPTVCLYSRLDNVVIPAVSAAWGNRVVAFDDLGHVSLLFAVEAFDIVLHELT